MHKSKADTARAADAVRVIKKYPNRRLYDTDTSSYITLAEVKALVMDNERRLQLVAVHGGEVIGQLGLEQYLRVRQAHVGSFGMGVATAWQGKGVGSRLLTAALDVADNWMNLHRVELTVYADNEAAHHLYRKFGFEVEGRLRDYALRDGVFVDTLSMARLRKSA